MNDHEFAPPEEEFEAVILAVARGEMDKASVAHFFGTYLRSA